MSEKPYRIICTDKVHFAHTVISNKTHVVYVNDDGKPIALPKDDVLAIFETREREVTSSFIRTSYYGDED